MGNDHDNDSVSIRLTYFLVGAGIGAVLALLFAPKSGEELRNDIADATRKGIDRSKDAAQQLGKQAADVYDATRTRAGEVYDATRTKAGEVYDSARETAGEYYEATRERASELYDTATARAGEVVEKTRDAATRQATSIQAAVEAGKQAYVEEKRKTELSGRTEAAPTYTPEKTM
jgi:gas vesicle protein